MKEDISTQLKEIRSNVKVKPSTDQIQIVAELEEGTQCVEGSWILFRPQEPSKRLNIYNNVHLFSQLKEAMRRLSGDFSWSIRYASQVRRENMPFLHSANTRTILFDPFMCFRDPIREFFSTKYFLWQIMPSNSYYFKSQAEQQAVFNELEMLASLSQKTQEKGSEE